MLHTTTLIGRIISSVALFTPQKVFHEKPHKSGGLKAGGLKAGRRWLTTVPLGALYISFRQSLGPSTIYAYDNISFVIFISTHL